MGFIDRMLSNSQAEQFNSDLIAIRKVAMAACGVELHSLYGRWLTDFEL